MATNYPHLFISHPTNLYEGDYSQWIDTTVEKIRQGKFADVDWENVLEELESLGKSEKRELKSRLLVLIEHLLKLAYWHEERDLNKRGWNSTIVEQRRSIHLLLEDSPSLKPFLADLFERCYADARKDTSRKTGLDISIFPENTPFSLDQVLDFDYPE